MFFKKRFFFYLFILILIPFEIYTQEDNKVIYNQDYFKQYNITNAADAIKRIPGIENLSSGNNSENYEPGSNNKKRGFGSSGTQILINGERQSSKSNNIINFPDSISKIERKVEAILFAASEPLDIETIEKKINDIKPDIFICGHSHILKVINDKKNDLLHINPGAAGDYGIHQVKTMIKFTIDKDNIKDLKIIELKR